MCDKTICPKKKCVIYIFPLAILENGLRSVLHEVITVLMVQPHNVIIIRRVHACAQIPILYGPLNRRCASRLRFISTDRRGGKSSCALKCPDPSWPAFWDSASRTLNRSDIARARSDNGFLSTRRLARQVSMGTSKYYWKPEPSEFDQLHNNNKSNDTRNWISLTDDGHALQCVAAIKTTAN